MSEIRGVWIANILHSRVLESETNIATAMDFLQEKGFNAVFPVVWNQGYTLYRSNVMESYGFPKIAMDFVDRNFDPLQVLIEAAHDRNLAVMPWFEYGFAASPIADGGYILQAKSHWAALDSLGKKVRHGGLTWMNGLHPEVQQFLLDLMLEVAQNYKVEGIQGCDRLPALPVAGSYDPHTKQRYNDEIGSDPPENENDSQWVQWRANILTEFVANLYHAVKAINSNLVVSMAPAVYPFCLNNLLQDSKAWVDKEILDFIHPQIYRETLEDINSRGMYQHEVNKITQMFNANKRAKFAPGIAFRANNTDVSVQDILAYIGLNRQSDFQGNIFFHYEGLRNDNDAIAIALQQQGGYEQVAALPSPFSVT